MSGVKAVVFDRYGDPDVLHVAEVEEPHAGPGQIRIAVRAASVNPIDWKLRSGALAQAMPVELPKVIGYDASGVIDEVGEGVGGVSEGDEVFGFGVGFAAAEWALLDDFATKPAGLAFEEAAGYPIAVETAVRALDLLGLEEGQTVLINGAAGGVGTAAVQIARARGARVIGTASEGNHDFLRALGAEPTTYGEGLVERVRELGGADLAFDTAGRGAIADLVEIAGSPDRVITIADYTAPQHGVRITGAAEGRSVPRARRGGDAVRGGQVQAAGRADLPVRRGRRGSPPQRGRARPREARPHALASDAVRRQAGCSAR
jgi:NADPH:quinone reductase-like Zn-dependent oxidoreductase